MPKDLQLPARMDYSSLDAIYAELKGARGEDIVLDGSRVTHLGSCGFQLLISALMSWEQDGHNMSVSSPSQKFREHLELLGLKPDMFDKTGALA